MTFKKFTGYVLVLMIMFSAVLAIGGIWGWIRGDTAGQLFATFCVIGGSAVGLGYATDKFLTFPQKEPPCIDPQSKLLMESSDRSTQH